MIQNKKILIIRLSTIANIVLASPIIRCVKKQIPNVELHFLSNTDCKRATDYNPYIDKFYFFDNFLDHTIKQLLPESYDYIIDLECNNESKKLIKVLNVKTYSAKSFSLKNKLLTLLKINLFPNKHVVHRFFDTVLPLHVKDDGEGLDFFIAKNDEVPVDDLPTAHSAGYYVLNIAGKNFTNRMPIQKCIELCNKLKHPIIIVGNREDMLAGAQIAAQDTIKIYNACGKFNHGEIANIIQKAKVVIGNVNELMYIACAFKKPIVALWGSNSSKFGAEPFYGQNFLQKQQKQTFANITLNLQCQPCSEVGFSTCPKKHFNCMQKIDINELLSQINLIY
ncbi:MAG: glycosyltransferase family 9 protein [Ferruginibacter sp.]|nr:glycosyltransferase family 9 protein [Ferruginibacter sp.]